MTVSNTNPYYGAPTTGMTRSYDLSIAPCSFAPDGVQIKNELCINGQYPGPLIEANYGDWIQVKVYNNIPASRGLGTTLHWHGVLQTNTTWQDGVPSVSSCPIAPGTSYTYSFRANLYGTSWYHSHTSAQYAGGVAGPLVIYGPSALPYDIDVGPVMLTDWYHTPWDELVAQTVAPLSQGGGPNVVRSNNVLINGKMSYDCSQTSLPCMPNAGISKFRFETGRTHRLRLINFSAQAVQKFSIDNHTMTVIAQDFVPVRPYNTTIVNLGVGQRQDVLVTATGNPSSAYYMRSNIAGCSNNDGISPLAVAAIYYPSANTSVAPKTTDNNGNTASAPCGNPPLDVTIPMYSMPANPPTVSDQFNYEVFSNGTEKLYTVNGSSYKGNYNSPTLQSVYSNSLNFSSQLNVYNAGANKTVRVILYNWNTDWHPMHIHGHNFQVLAVGQGSLWNNAVTRPSNPQRRDTQLLPPGDRATGPGYIVVQWDQDNPGVWAFHCHIAWHVSTGFFMQIIERPDDIKTFPQIPGALSQTCDTWNQYTSGKVVVDDIDSGV